MKADAEKAARAVFARELEEVKPTKKELEDSVMDINHLTASLKKIVPKDIEIRVVGSVVRGTQLRGESDVDVFLLFPKKYKREKITKDGLDYAKRLARASGDTYEVKYAEHPYARLFVRALAIRADIVPAYNIDNIEDMSTSVDRSPMHADFINKHLSTKQRDEVRVLKHLLKRQGLYGAEVRTSGFSGYLCELLIYQYGSLTSLMESASSFKPPVLLDPKGRRMLSDPSLVKRFNSMFIVIDPVDRERNVAAGVSTETLARFVLLCRKFTKKPSASFFNRGGFSSPKVKEMLGSFMRSTGLDMYAIATRLPDKSEDIVWPQLRKVLEMVEVYARSFGFSIYLSMPLVVGATGLLVFFAPKETFRTHMRKGPSVFIRKAQEEFEKAHRDAKGMLVTDDILYALEKNEYDDIGSLMRSVASGRVVGRRKDINLRNSKLFVNQLPQKETEAVYAALAKTLGF